MNKEQEDILNRYLRGDLTQEECQQVEEWIATDPEAARELDTLRHIVTAFERVNEREALEELMSMDVNRTTPKVAASPPVARRIAIIGTALLAASVALLLYIGFRPQYSAEELFTMHYTALPYEEMPHRGADGLMTPAQEETAGRAITQYRQGNFVEASQLFDDILGQAIPEHLPEDLIIYASVSYIETGKLDKAEQLLAYVHEHGKLFRYDAAWYLALIRLGEGRRNEARTLLQPLVTEENIYQQEALELLNQINTRKWF